MSRIILNTKIWLFVLLFGMSFPAWAQSDDFNTWTKFKVNYKIDSRFSVSGDLELRMKDDVSRLDRWFIRNSKSSETEKRESIL